MKDHLEFAIILVGEAILSLLSHPPGAGNHLVRPWFTAS